MEQKPVWVNEARCKACSLCVAVCPSGALAMRADPRNTLGAMVKVIAPESCVGCGECELSCPDFAISVADRKTFGFAKLNDTLRQAAAAIRANNFYEARQ
jgi:2-oxoglutarate ferredoxin oxidoreductase subunit delta